MSVPAASQTVLKPDDARLTAGQLLSTGNPRAAEAILRVLIERDPEDSASHILLAHAHRMQGDYDAAHEAARTGWRHAERDIEKYGAAIATAQALSKRNQKSRAQLWLRRAAHVAPDEALRARAVRDYNYVRATNPWSVRLRFGATPSNNVNNAPRDNSYILGGLVFVNPAAVPLSGIEVSAGADVRYNFNISQTRRDFARISWDQTRVVLTDDDVPDGVSASDFTYTKLETTIGRDWQAAKTAPRRTASLSFGRIWYGGDHLSDEVTARYRQSHILGDTQTSFSRLSWWGTVGYADRQDNGLRSGYTTTLGAVWAKPFAAGGHLALTAEIGMTDTNSVLQDHEALTLGATYILPAEPMGAVTSLSAVTNFRRYDGAAFGPDPRKDDKLTLSTSLFFKDFDTHGFAPKVTFSASRTNSNISLFETENIGVSIGYQSVF